MSPQWAESVDFNDIGFILIESTIFEIFGSRTFILGFYIVLTPSTTLFYIMHLKSPSPKYYFSL